MSGQLISKVLFCQLIITYMTLHIILRHLNTKSIQETKKCAISNPEHIIFYLSIIRNKCLYLTNTSQFVFYKYYVQYADPKMAGPSLIRPAIFGSAYCICWNEIVRRVFFVCWEDSMFQIKC